MWVATPLPIVYENQTTDGWLTHLRTAHDQARGANLNQKMAEIYTNPMQRLWMDVG